jgi:hypothetical protein
MGLRSPQQLEQVQVGVPNLPLVEAGKTSTIDLATPAKEFMDQKSRGDQIDSVNKIVITRKDALSKIKSKYAVENVTHSQKSRMASLVGNNAVTQSQGLYDEAKRGLEELQQKAPADLADQVARDSAIKLQELQTLMEDKIGVEGRKDAVDTGNSVTKLFTDSASSKFEDKENFRKDLHQVYDYSMATEALKGGGRIEQELSSAAKASNAVVEGVKFSLGLAATPDKVEKLSKYFEEDILKDGEIFVSEPDQTKIRKAFTAAIKKTEGDLGYANAAEAQRLGLNPVQAREYTFKNARGSTKAATQGFALYNQLETARKAELEKTDRETFGEVQKLTKAGRPDLAEQKTASMTPKGQKEARDYLNATEGGTAKAFTNPEHRKKLSNMQQTDREAFAKENLDKYYLSRDDRRAMEAAKRVIGRETQDRQFAIDNGSLEVRSDSLAHLIAQKSMGLTAKIDTKLAAQISLNARDIFYIVRDKYKDAEAAVIMGHVKDAMMNPNTGVLKGISKPGYIGSALNAVGFDTSSVPWLNNDKNIARPSDEFVSQPQTGGKDQIRVQEPTAPEILKFQSDAIERGAAPLTKIQAYDMMIKLRRSKKMQTP